MIIFACNKDKLQTKPSIKIKDVNATEIGQDGTLEITMEYGDKEGDLSEGQLTYVRNRTNIKPIPNPLANDKADTVRYPLPKFSDRSRGEIQVSIPYDFMTEDPNDNDTMFFRIAVQDRAGNVSDTIQTGNVIAREF